MWPLAVAFTKSDRPAVDIVSVICHGEKERDEAGEPRQLVRVFDIQPGMTVAHMYHEIAQPYALLYNLVPALKPGARVGIVDAFRPTSEHGTPPSLLSCELAAIGYREISIDRLMGSQAYLAIVAPPSVASRTRPEAMVACKAS